MEARDRPRSTARRLRWVLALLVASSIGGASPAARADSVPVFTDWSAVSDNIATGTLLGSAIVLSGSHVWNPPQSVLDGSWTYFDGPDFSPALPTTDEIQISGAPGYAYTLQFGAPVTDPVLELGSLGSRLDFPAGTQIERLSGDSNFAVSGSTITGAVAPVGQDGVSDANGTVELKGTFQSISFSATYPPGPEDGILLQVGAPPTPPPVPPAASPVASFVANPNPTCVGTPTTLDARASTPGTGGPIVSYMYGYITGFPDSRLIILSTSSSPQVTVAFPWSRQDSSGLGAGLSPWVRDPVALTLMVTDSSGYTATATNRIDFAQHSSDDSRAGCPDGTDPPSPTAPTMIDGRPTASAGWANVPLRCGTTGLGCFGNLFVTVASLHLEAERARAAYEDEQLHARIAKGEATPAQREQEKKLGAELKRLLARLTHMAQMEDNGPCNGHYAGICAARDARAPRPAILGAVAYAVGAGQAATIKVRLSRAAYRVLSSYRQLRVTLNIAEVTPLGSRVFRQRHLTIVMPAAQRPRPAADPPLTR